MQAINNDAHRYERGSYGIGGYHPSVYRRMYGQDSMADWRNISELIETTVATAIRLDSTRGNTHGDRHRSA